MLVSKKERTAQRWVPNQRRAVIPKPFEKCDFLTAHFQPTRQLTFQSSTRAPPGRFSPKSATLS